MATPPQGARSKAAKLRKQLASGEISDIDRLWLEDYAEKTNGSGDWGKSASRTRVHRTETVEEDKAAEGTGTAAAHAAGLALMAKEEGKRLDTLTVNAIEALKQAFQESRATLKEAVDVYKLVGITLLERTKVLEETHVSMLQNYQAEFFARIDAEADLRDKEKEAEGDSANTMLMAVLAKHLGIELPGMKAAPPKNGASKKGASKKG